MGSKGRIMKGKFKRKDIPKGVTRREFIRAAALASGVVSAVAVSGGGASIAEASKGLAINMAGYRFGLSCRKGGACLPGDRPGAYEY